ncbi:glutamic acid-rich protein-like [Saccostrea cucullata]|uniref:glutamic acid-rich protein-like n=1 Tax=Saccostrea cuccullata TaxID=36930 RepID=UPI002ED6A655
MKQKKSVVSCPRRHLKQTKQHDENSGTEKTEVSQRNRGSNPKIKKETIVIPAASNEKDYNHEDLDTSESDQLGNSVSEVVIVEESRTNKINGSISESSQAIEHSGINDSENLSAEEVLKSDIHLEARSKNSSESQLMTYTENKNTDVKTDSDDNNVDSAVEKNFTPESNKKDMNDICEMKGNMNDLNTIVEESEEKAETRNSSRSSYKKSSNKSTQLRRSSGTFMSSPRRSSRHSFSCVEDKKLLKEKQDLRRSHSAVERPKSKMNRSHSDPFKFTKAELEWYLPRKSFFDCHDKALKDAGLETAETTNRMEQMKQRVAEKIRKEREMRERRQQLENPVPEEQAAENTVAREIIQETTQDNKSECDVDTKSEIDKNEDEDDTVISKLQEAQTSPNKPTSSRKISRQKKKALGDDEDDVRVDYQPLLYYLKYVQEHPEEFYSHRKQSAQQEHVGSRASPWIVRLAEITNRRNMNTAQCLTTHSAVVEAARDIRPRTTDPGQWTMSQKERSLLGSIAPGKGNVFTAIKQDLPTHDSQNQDDGKSDFEKEKMKLEKWLKTVSTAGLMKAKELALRELGEEDSYQTKWWSTLQTCSYLRQKGINSN